MSVVQGQVLLMWICTIVTSGGFTQLPQCLLPCWIPATWLPTATAALPRVVLGGICYHPGQVSTETSLVIEIKALPRKLQDAKKHTNQQERERSPGFGVASTVSRNTLQSMKKLGIIHSKTDWKFYQSSGWIADCLRVAECVLIEWHIFFMHDNVKI